MKQVRCTVVALALLAACRGEAPRAPGDPGLTRLVDSLVPPVEQATGLTFKRHPRAVLITREQAHAYLEHQLAKQFPEGRARHLADAYRLLGLLPDSLDLEHLFLSVLTEQVAGYYDPDSSAFFGVAGAEPVAFRITVAHELVHALQHDYVPLDSILDDRADGDRLAAAQAVLEGQATLAMFRAQPQIGARALDPTFWDDAREAIKQQQGSMPEFNSAPRVIRETLLFPYIAGAEYMRWWTTAHPAGEMPYGARMPRSTEEILAPGRAGAASTPLHLTLTGGGAIYGDILGASEMRVLLAEARHQEGLVDPVALGWGGDRYQVYDAKGKPALVWIAAFDGVPPREAMFAALSRRQDATRPGYRTAVERLDVSGHPGLRLVVAPTDWPAWSSLPTATATPEE